MGQGPVRNMNRSLRQFQSIRLALILVTMGIAVPGCASSGGREAYFESRVRIVEPRNGDGSAILAPYAPSDSLANARAEMPAEAIHP